MDDKINDILSYIVNFRKVNTEWSREKLKGVERDKTPGVVEYFNFPKCSDVSKI